MPNRTPGLCRARRIRLRPSPRLPLDASFPGVISFVFWTAVAVCVIAQVFIIAGAVRVRTREDADPSVPHPARATEIGWTIVPAIGLALLLFFTHRAIDRTEAGQSPSARIVHPK